MSRNFIVIALLVLVAVVSADDKGLPEASWLSYEQGLAAAKENGKPIMVLFTQPWCGACKNLKSQLKSDPSSFLAAAENLNLVSIEGETIEDEKKLFSVDGGYIPRAYFLSPDGKPNYDIAGPNSQYKYFFGSPSLLVQAMTKAVGLGGGKKEL